MILLSVNVIAIYAMIQYSVSQSLADICHKIALVFNNLYIHYAFHPFLLQYHSNNTIILIGWQAYRGDKKYIGNTAMYDYRKSNTGKVIRHLARLYTYKTLSTDDFGQIWGSRKLGSRRARNLKFCLWYDWCSTRIPSKFQVKCIFTS